MLDVTGFKVVEVLAHGARSTVARAERTADGARVVLKALTLASPDAHDVARYRFAWETGRTLNAPEICRTLQWLEPDGRSVLVLEDIGGRSLGDRLAGRPLTVEEALRIGIALARALEALHAAGVVHRDVNPSNVVVTADLARIQLIDLDVASRLPREMASARPPERLEGTLAYLAPEQSGRVNRPVDRRSDLYALGVTLYEALVGARPFVTDDPLELLHAHLALTPAAPHERADVPRVLSRIVMRLLAKMPEDRYQSAAGLLADLERCLADLTATGTVGEFPLGTRDLSPELEVPGRLYGRDAERRALAEAYVESRRSRAGFTLVRGPAGIGKSALVRDLARSVSRDRGSYATGKYQQVQNAPLSGLVDAVRDVLRDVLASSPARRAAACARAIPRLDGLAPSLVEHLPELALLLDVGTTALPGQAAETQARLRLGFVRLLGALATPEHPVVLFLDDLQWADHASLQIVEAVLKDGTASDLLFVGAVRDEALTDDHPVQVLLRTATDAGAPTRVIALAPLAVEAVGQLLADTLHTTLDAVEPLAAAVHRKTGGNPFFAERLLRLLHQDGTLRLDPAAGRWAWDLAAVEAGDVADNVASLLAQALGRLPEATRATLQIAASLGGRFDLGTLALVTGEPPGALAAKLAPAVDEGLLAPRGDDHRLLGLLGDDADVGALGWRFLHDRLQQAAWELVDEPARQAGHLAIGRALTDRLPPAAQQQRLFEIVGHLDRGRALLTDPESRVSLASLNLDAGRRAAAASDFAGALEYLGVGFELLGDAAWSDHHALAFGLTMARAESAPMAGRAELAGPLLDEALAHAADPMEAFTAQLGKLNLLTFTGRFADAVEFAMDVVASLGGPRPRTVEEWGAEMGKQLGELAEAQAGRAPAELLDAPAMTDPAASAEIAVLATVAGASMAFAHVFPVIVVRMVNLSLRHGNAIPSPVGYAAYGFLLVAMGQPAAGTAFGELALKLAERCPVPSVPPTVQHVTATYVWHWSHRYDEAAELCRTAMEGGIRAGSFVTTGWASISRMSFSMARGAELAEMEAEALRVAHQCGMELSYPDGATFARLYANTAAQLRGTATADPSLLEAIQHYPAILAVGLGTQLMAATFLGDDAGALALVAQLEPMIPLMGPAPSLGDLVVYAALARTKAALEAEGEAREALLGAIDAGLGQLTAWAALCPENQEPRRALVQAERHALAGDVAAATDAYDAAIAAAAASTQTHIEALAAERAGHFHLRRGRRTIGLAYLGEARRAYGRWGAAACVQALDAAHPELRAVGGTRGGTISATVTSSGGSVEVEALLRATRTIAAEQSLEALLDALLRLALQVSGAERGAIIVVRDRQARVQAIGDESRVEVLGNLPVEGSQHVSPEIVGYALATQDAVTLEDAAASSRFSGSAYVTARQPRSVSCVPLVARGTASGAIYLENNLATGVFTPDRIELLRVLAAQAAAAVENAVLVERLRRQAEELQRKNEQLTEVDRLREDLLARTSHELRTPLNGIIGLAEGLRDDAPEGARGTVDMIVASGRRLSTLVDDLLDVSALESGRLTLHPAAVDVRGVIEATVGLSRPLVRGKEVTFTLAVADDLPAVWADRDRVEQVLLNLVGNATKFTERGAIEVGARRHPDAPDARVELWVKDTGIGIAADAMERIFQPFEQAEEATARTYGGTGLGLAISRQIVELHGGRLTASSAPGEGSTFSLSLPIATAGQRVATGEPAEAPRERASAADAPVAAAVSPPASLAGGDGPVVLVVDDEPVNLQVLVQQLTRRGYRPVPARSGPEALGLLDDGLRPDLVLLDVMMPGMDGYEVCARLRESHPAVGLPVVMLTARNRTADIVAGLQAGANDYLTKPFSEAELFARIRSHLELSRVNGAITRFVPAPFLHLLGRESLADVLLGDAVEREMSVLFADVRGYTTLSEALSPAENFQFLNELLGVLEPVLLAHGGFVDKYLGDAIMALFSGPPDDAVRAGVAMHAALVPFNRRRVERGELPVRIGVGVNTGRLILGTVGSPERMDTTAVSDAVNVASRVEGLTKRYGAALLVTDATVARLERPEALGVRLLDRIQVRGKVATTTVHEVYDALPDAARAGRAATRAQFERAVRLFHDRQPAEAARLFQLCQVLDPMDDAVRQYLQRCEAIQQQFTGLE